jgi:hypothetical protein
LALERHDPHVAAGRLHRARGMLAISIGAVVVALVIAMAIIADARPRSIYLVDGVNRAASTTIIWVPKAAPAPPAAPVAPTPPPARDP